MLTDASEGGSAAARSETLIDSRLVFRKIPERTRDEVLRELATRIAATAGIREPDELASKLLERERLGCTGLGAGIAIPHCKSRAVEDVLVAVATTEEPIDFGAADGAPVDLIIAVVSPVEAAAAHLQALARVSRLLRTPGIADALRRAESRERMLDLLRGAEAGLPVAR